MFRRFRAIRPAPAARAIIVIGSGTESGGLSLTTNGTIASGRRNAGLNPPPPMMLVTSAGADDGNANAEDSRSDGRVEATRSVAVPSGIKIASSGLVMFALTG